MENDAVLLGEAGARFWLAGLGDQLAYRLGHSCFAASMICRARSSAAIPPIR
jgi:hypothetical protein